MYQDFRLSRKKTKMVAAYLEHGCEYEAAIAAGYTRKQASYAEDTLFQEIPVLQAISAANRAEFGTDDEESEEYYLNSGLTSMMARFALECSQEDNMLKAAHSAGYYEESARDACKEAIENPLFLEAVQLHTDAQIKRVSLTKDRVLSEIMKIAFFDIRKIFDEFGKLISPEEYDDDTAAVVSEYNVSEHKFGTNIKTKTHDKIKALIALGQHLDIFKDDRGKKPEDDDNRDISNVELMAKAAAFVQAATRGNNE